MSINKEKPPINELTQDVNHERERAFFRYMAWVHYQAQLTGENPERIIAQDLQAPLPDVIDPKAPRHYTYETAYGTLEYLTGTRKKQIAISPLKEALIELTPTLGGYLRTLISNPTRICSPDYLYSSLNERLDPEEGVGARVRTGIVRLREALGHTNESPLIFTIKSRGYTLDPTPRNSNEIIIFQR